MTLAHTVVSFQQDNTQLPRSLCTNRKSTFCFQLGRKYNQLLKRPTISRTWLLKQNLSNIMKRKGGAGGENGGLLV